MEGENNMKKFIVQQKPKKPYTDWGGRKRYGTTSITTYADTLNKAKKSGLINKTYKITAILQEVWKPKKKRKRKR